MHLRAALFSACNLLCWLRQAGKLGPSRLPTVRSFTNESTGGSDWQSPELHDKAAASAARPLNMHCDSHRPSESSANGSPEAITISPSILYFGTPVILLTTLDVRGRANITPMSSAWALGDRLVLGLSGASQGALNLRRAREGVVNVASASQWPSVEAIARTTGREEVPPYKHEMGYRHESNKFSLGGFTPVLSAAVSAPRIAECPIQFEVQVVAIHDAAEHAGAQAPDFMIAEAAVLRTHAHRDIVRPGTDHVDTSRWQPLLYVFRHYFGTGPRLARNFRAET